MASSVPDTFISGDGNPIWAIPLFAKPGVSGGGYYRNGNLQGLVTKISLAGEPIALATPFTKIAKLIFSNHEVENSVSWDNELMIYKGKNQTIAIQTTGGCKSTRWEETESSRPGTLLSTGQTNLKSMAAALALSK